MFARPLALDWPIASPRLSEGYGCGSLRAFVLMQTKNCYAVDCNGEFASPLQPLPNNEYSAAAADNTPCYDTRPGAVLAAWARVKYTILSVMDR